MKEKGRNHGSHRERGSEVVYETVDGLRFPWLRGSQRCPVTTEEIGGRTVRIVDVTGTHPVLDTLNRRLNGSTQRANSLIRTSIGRGLANGGVVQGAQILRERIRGNSLIGVATTDPNERTRLSAVYTAPDADNTSYVVSRSMYEDSRKVLQALAGVGYVSSGRGN